MTAWITVKRLLNLKSYKYHKIKRNNYDIT